MCNNLNHKIENTADYLRGMRDAKDGKPAEVGASDSYMNAYNFQVQSVQQLADMGLSNQASIFQ